MTQPLSSPASHIGGATLSGRDIAKALRENALLAFPPEAFEEDVVARSFFGRKQLILNRSAGIHHILVERPENYRRTAATVRILRPLLGKGLLLSEGEDWKHQRRIIAPAFAPRMVATLARHTAENAAALIARLAACGEQPVDLLGEMQSLALKIAAASLFSLAMDRYADELRALITGYAEGIGRPGVLDFLLPLSIPSPRDLARRRFRRRWMDLIARLIVERQAMSPGTTAPDLFDLLRAAPGPLPDHVATMILAGHETTGVALFWALYLAAITPGVQQRIAAEAATLDLGPDSAADTLAKLTYTRAVVQETLRLYPPAFTLVRQARIADDAGGTPVPAGAVVMIAPWVLHRHRRLWERAESFDPARFLPGAPPPDRFAYLPFGIGPRVCIGAQFALTETILGLASMIQAFHIERASDEPVVPVAIVTTQPDHPPLFRLHRRAGRLGS